MNGQTKIIDFHVAKVESTILADISPKEREQCRGAIRRLSRHLGREARLSDFTMPTLTAFEDAVRDVSNYRRARKLAERLRRTWKVAYAAGLCPFAPERRANLTPADKAICSKPGRPGRPKLPELAPEGSIVKFFNECYRPLRLRGKSANTSRLYANTFRMFGKHLGRPPMLTDLRDDVVSGYLTSIAARGCAAATAEKERVQLLALWRFACRKGIIKDWPDVLPELCPARVPQAWTRDELARLWESIDQTTGTIAGVPAAAWWRALHLVLWYTGERISAVLQLTWDDLAPAEGWLIVRAEYRKGGRQDKPNRLPSEAIEAIEAIRAPERRLIFHWPLTYTAIFHHYGKILKRAGLPLDRKSKFHRVRKSAASHFEAAGGNATALLGHSNRKVTLSYLDPRIVTPQQGADLLFVPGVGT